MPELHVAMLTPHGDPLGRIGEPEVGGQCVYIRELSRVLAREGVRVTAFTRDRGEGRPEEEIAPGATVVRLKGGPRRFIRKEDLGPFLDEFTLQVNERLGDGAVLHSHFWDGAHVAGKLRRGSRWVHTSHSLGLRKLAAMPHELRANYEPRIEAETRALLGSDAVVASTEVEVEDLVSLYGARREKVRVIPPGVDTSRFAPGGDRSRFRRELGLPVSFPLVGTLGRLDSRKGFDLFLRAAAEISASNVDARFALSTGKGSDETERAEHTRLQAVVREGGLADRVIWLGILEPEQLSHFYGSLDVFVMPSRYELFGIAMLEAMACGVPVVATRFGGPAEVITHGRDGFLVDPTNISELAGAITGVLADGSLSVRVGREARMKVQERFSWEAAAQRHIDLYAGAAEGGS